MIDGQKILAVITARGGSKGLPGKNIRPLAGVPLIGWSIRAARGSALVDRTIVSTDDENIARVARECGGEVPFIRDAKLAGDATPSLDVVLDALDRVPGFDIVVLLQPTSPLRTSDDVDGAIRLCIEKGAPTCVSVCEADKSPYWMYTVSADARMNPVLPAENRATRRQDLPTVHVLNGALYVARVNALRNTRAFVTGDTVAYPMPKTRSVDIDTATDFLVAEHLLTGLSQ